MRLEGNTAIVTGGGSGFGAGIVTRFAQEGANVVVADIDEERGRHVAETVIANGGKAIYAHADVTKKDDVAALLSVAISTYGSVNAVVNNAGTTHRRKPTGDVVAAEFEIVFSVNVKSIFLSAQVMVPYFRQAGGGIMINIASIAAFRVASGLAAYNASKAAVISLTRSFAMEYGPENIRFNCVNPAAGDTPLLEQFMGEPITPALRERYVSAVPLRRFTTPQDVAGACVFLASADASFITGACIDVDGGRSI